jgi:orotidine-5'-phosphate decarboxylase
LKNHPNSLGVAVSTDPRIIVALDYDSLAECEALLATLDPSVCRLKVGKELFTACGPRVVEAIQDRGFQVFLDLKFHDIPATVAKAVKAAARLGVWMLNVHASGGPRMLEAAAEALAVSGGKTLLIGVTVLTSMEQAELDAIGVQRPLQDQVLGLAGLVSESGLSGVVCSAREAAALRVAYGRDFVLVTPGIRPVGAEGGDQRRIVTPQAALQAGSNYLVIGRPITQAPDPAAACREIALSLLSIG